MTSDVAAGRPATKGLYEADTMMQLHKSQDNIVVQECYAKYLDGPGSHAAHELLHTSYQTRRRIEGESLVVLDSEPPEAGRLGMRGHELFSPRHRRP